MTSSRTLGVNPETASAEQTIAGVERVASLITNHRPIAVAGVLRRLSNLVSMAVGRSEAPKTPWRTLRFPFSGDAEALEEYQSELRQLIDDVGCDGPD